IRTNEVNEIGIVGTPQDQGWRLYQFQLVKNCPDGGACTARMVPAPLPGTPSARFLNASDPDPRGSEFRAEFLRQLPGLISPDPNQFSVNYPDRFLMFESNSTALGPDHKYPEQFEAGLASTEGQQFRDLIQQRLTELQSDLTPEQVLRRMQSQTCGGCHLQTLNGLTLSIDFGDGVPIPRPFLF